MRPDLPTGTITFLFTDVEESTQLLQELGADRYRDALESHRRLLRDVFQRHGGHEVDTQGDSFFVAFGRAQDAVRAAQEAQGTLARHAWPEGRELRVRMGIHSCEATTTGEGYVGVGVHRGARICAAGHGGQVLLSHTTHGLIEEDDTGFGFLDLGEHRLKDLSEPHRLFQLLDAPLPRFPALKTLETRPTTHPLRLLTLTGVAVLASVFAAWLVFRPQPPTPVTRFALLFEEQQGPTGTMMEFTTDGSVLVYVGPDESGQGSQLWTRRWADLDAAPIRGTEGVVTFARSPDGGEVAFVAGFPAPLRVVAPEGGAIRTLLDQVYMVADWAPDGTLYFNGGRGLGRIPASGGGSEAVEIVTELLGPETVHANLRVLPGGRMGVFQVWYSVTGEDAEIWAIDLNTHERRLLTLGNNPHYASTGHLLFGTPDGALMAAPIDPGTAELTGPPVPVAEDLTVNATSGLVTYAVSESGTLIYSAGGVTGTTTELVWVTRSGDAAPVEPGWRFETPSANYGWGLSPDGAQVAFPRQVDGNVDIWIKQLLDGPLERLTFDDRAERYPVWAPDGQFVTYVKSESGGNYDVWQRRADGTGAPELLLDDQRSLYQGQWREDGEWMVFRTLANASVIGERDIVGFRPGVDSVTIPLVATAEFAEQDPALSSDGRWLAYTSNETGRAEVYVRPFPDVDSYRVRLSTDGGSGPLWANSGSELFFVDADRRLIVVEVETDSEIRIVQRKTLFTIGPEYRLGGLSGGSDFYDIAPDDQRFLMGRFAGTAALSGDGRRFILVQNFFEELERLVPN